MMRQLANLLAGLLFGAGLIGSGMTQNQKVLAFLDVTGRWDPSLAFVMLGAIAAYSLLSARIRRRRRASFGGELDAGIQGAIDRNLILGAALFGVGWGLVGICPGPALVIAGAGSAPGLSFAVAMVLGMALRNRQASPTTSSTPEAE